LSQKISSTYDLVGSGAKSWEAWCIFFLQFLRRQLNCWRFVPWPLRIVVSNSSRRKQSLYKSLGTKF
jgi:hypothetical protein